MLTQYDWERFRQRIRRAVEAMTPEERIAWLAEYEAEKQPKPEPEWEPTDLADLDF